MASHFRAIHFGLLLLSNSVKLRCSDLKSVLKRFITALPITLLMMIILGYAFFFGAYSRVAGLRGVESGLTPEEFIEFALVLGIDFTIYAVFLIFFKRIRNLIATKVSAPLVTRHIDRRETRQQALVIGAVLFTLGF